MPPNKLIMSLYCSLIELVHYYNASLRLWFGTQTVTFISLSAPAWIQSMTANKCDRETVHHR